MKFLALCAVVLSGATAALAQSVENSPAPSQIDALTKKVDEINTKLDALSQQLLKLEQQISKPGVIVGETAPAPPSVTSPGPEATHIAGGEPHVVARGETLTSIAKQHKVSVEELQKFNHIEDGRKLQAGQTIVIPSPTASPGISPTSSPGD